MSQVTPVTAPTSTASTPMGTASTPTSTASTPMGTASTPTGTASTPTDGRSTRWDDHRQARRTELVRAARRCVHRHGPDVSMEEIAAEAATSKSIVYRYFTDKTALQVAVGEAVVTQMHDALDAAVSSASTPREGLRSMIDVYLEMVEASPHVYWFVTRPSSEAASAPLGHFLDAVARLIARPLVAALTEERPHAAASAVNPDLWAAGAVGFVRGAGEWWLTHRGTADAPTRAELAERVTAWLWAGPVGALSGRARTAQPTTSPDHPTPQDDPTATDHPTPDQAGTGSDLDEEMR